MNNNIQMLSSNMMSDFNYLFFHNINNPFFIINNNPFSIQTNTNQIFPNLQNNNNNEF